jgi:hypothetical protein
MKLFTEAFLGSIAGVVAGAAILVTGLLCPRESSGTTVLTKSVDFADER